ncbi:MAG TPA: PQQ-dependent sugar dehydrogenase, partial [Acidimicrobiales bacterium]|nr:PQQ-dependent sugar dehydrogenase [Acidimicrobiales bacterium]
PPPPPPPPPPSAPNLTVQAVVGGLSQPWDVDWLPDGTLLLTQRGAGLFVVRNGVAAQLTNGGSDFWASGETGMMGLAVDGRFSSNRRVYTCQGSTDNSPAHGNSVKVVAWQLDAGVTTATRLHDVVTGIDATSGRHGGCRLEMAGGALWVTTGDAAFGTNPQNLGSLGGKVLRVNPDHTNTAAPGNPFAVFGTQSLIYTYGHRNVQGLAFRSDGSVWSAEHGPDRDDEINVLSAGANYGWDPVPGYNESVPMTDAGKYPSARFPAWASGVPTVATSGMTFLHGAHWGPWQGALAVATLKDSRLRIQFYAGATFAGEQIPSQFDRAYGRLRTAQQGPDGCLYVLTGNGNDAVIRACAS